MKEITPEEKLFLLNLSRKVLDYYFKNKEIPKITDISGNIPGNLEQLGATFVTLTKNHNLRGCIGKLEATQPIFQDVIDNTFSSAFEDNRFNPLTERELKEIKIEISILTPLTPFEYRGKDDLLRMLDKKKPGLVIKKDYNTATFLPQVWEDLPNSNDFLNHLCQKAGLPYNYWQENHLNIFTYKVINFSE